MKIQYSRFNIQKLLAGKKTRIAAGGFVMAGILIFFFPLVSMSIAMFSLALGFFGLYDRQMRTAGEQSEKINDLKSRIKKPRRVG